MWGPLKFWWQATNRHGVHSPFVYGFLDKGLYRRELRRYPAQKRLLLAAVDYFGIGSVIAPGPGSSAGAWLREKRPGLRWDTPPTDLFIYDDPNEDLLALPERAGLWHDHSILFVGNIRKDRGRHEIWRQACEMTEARVILETYAAGLLFFRKQQAPQHFRIRI
jgi:hypothetical protein